jgi:predicted TIM-barrel fold metal-dependent hydrolase
MSADAPATEFREAPARQRIIDTDVHEMLVSSADLLPYLDEPWQRYIRSGFTSPYWFSYAYPVDGGFARVDAKPETGPAGSDYEQMRKQHLDLYDIDRAVLTSLFFPTDSRVQYEFGNALATAYNDWLVETWLNKDERFLGSICVNANDPVAAAREIDRMAAHPQFVQVLLPANDKGYGETQYDPIFAAANRNGVVVSFHPSSRAETAIGSPPYLMERRTLAVPQQFMCQVVSIVSHGVFERYPELRVAVIEGGWTWLPFVMRQFDQNYRSLRIEVPWLKRMPSDVIREHIRFSTQPLVELTSKQFLGLVDDIGSEDMLMFSSDYPHWDFDSPDTALPAMPDDLRNKIMYENARTLYGL